MREFEGQVGQLNLNRTFGTLGQLGSRQGLMMPP